MGPKEGETLTEAQLAAIRAAVQEAHKSSKLSDAGSGDKNSGTRGLLSTKPQTAWAGGG